MNPDPAGEGLHISLLLPTPRDAALTARLLGEEGIATRVLAGLHALDPATVLASGALMVGEEWLAMGALPALREALARQPTWSDLPIIVVARAGMGSDHIGRVLDQLGNATLLDRPLRVAALTSAAHAALRARVRQYQIRSQLDALESARAELAEAAERKDEFIAMLGHELRNPLAPIRNALYMLRQQEQTNPEHRRLLDTMQRQTDHMVRLIGDLVDVARLSRGTIELRRERVRLDEVVAAAVELSRPLIARAGHRLHVDADTQGLEIVADRVRMAQVFSNLLNNAAKYSERNGSIEVRIRQEDGQALVEVADRGKGIDARTLPSVFDMFVQGARDPGQINDGLGIGLSLVRRLVELHGGRVAARSAGPGQGSTFEVRLPLAAPAAGLARPAPARPAAPVASKADPGKAPLRVLVVDDNRDAADTLRLLLDTLGIEAATAYSGDAALKAVEDWAPAALFLDIGMPHMDGYEVARRIRARAGGPGIWLVALTGWSQARDQARSRAAGFDFHLSKPADFEELQRILSVVAQGARAAQPLPARDAG